MKKVLLIGDSIRMGYDKYVRESLSGEAEVYYPDENCRFAEYVLRYAHEWKEKLGCTDDIDLVHWNAGLWDALELFDDEPLSTPEYYENVIRRIDKRLRLLFPKAKMIFATSTAVIEEMARPEFKRHNSIIKKYNAIALEALRDTDTLINDLYSITEDAPRGYHSDWVHYSTREGTAFLGGKVSDVIASELGIKKNEINAERFIAEKYSKDSIGM